MKDVFGNKLLRVFKEVNQNLLVAAWTKKDATTLLLTSTNIYGSIDEIKLVSIKGMGYAGNKCKII